jgi:hypothetical protein
MSETTNCQYCNSNLTNRGFFCPSCGKQVRCKNCFEFLEPNANACVICCTKISQEIPIGKTEPSSNDYKKQESPLNTFEYRETQNSKILKASFTDAVGNSLNETLNNFIDNRLLASGVRKPLQTERIVDPLKQLHSGEPIILDNPPSQNLPSVELLSNNTFDRIFRLEDQELIILEPRLKAKTKLDYSKKFTLLVIYFHTVIQRKSIDKAQLRSVLKKANLLNNHLQSWLSKTTDITNSSSGLELSIPAQEQVSQILRDMFDVAIPEGWMPDGNPKASSSKRSTNKQSIIEINETPIESSKKRVSSNSKLTPAKMIDKLIEQGYFSEKHTIGDIIKYCSSQLAQTRKTSELSPILTRYIRDGKLKRQQNSDNQYEYYA